MNTSSRSATVFAVIIIIASSVLILSIQNPFFPQITIVPFEVVDPGDATMQYNYATRANFTIANASHWESLWSLLYSGWSNPPEVPVVNFTSELQIAVFQGLCGSGGYYTNITEIHATTTQYVVFVDEIHPGPGCVVADVLTYPYQIVKVSHQPLYLPLQFVYNIIETDCG